MSKYFPSRWIIIRVQTPDGPLDKILAGWSGGYLDGDSWKLSSGITKVEELGDEFVVTNHSGSVYYLNRSGVGVTMLSASVLAQIGDNPDVTVYDSIRSAKTIFAEYMPKTCTGTMCDEHLTWGTHDTDCHLYEEKK